MSETRDGGRVRRSTFDVRRETETSGTLERGTSFYKGGLCDKGGEGARSVLWGRVGRKGGTLEKRSKTNQVKGKINQKGVNTDGKRGIRKGGVLFGSRRVIKTAD
jgi:hypothetical protein